MYTRHELRQKKKKHRLCYYIDVLYKMHYIPPPSSSFCLFLSVPALFWFWFFKRYIYVFLPELRPEVVNDAARDDGGVPLHHLAHVIGAQPQAPLKPCRHSVRSPLRHHQKRRPPQQGFPNLRWREGGGYGGGSGWKGMCGLVYSNKQV